MTTRNERKTLTGVVVKESGKNTISVLVETLRSHPVYKKVMTTSTKYLVHDEEGKAKVGDKVSIMSCKPISKNKSWRLSSSKTSVKSTGKTKK